MSKDTKMIHYALATAYKVIYVDLMEKTLLGENFSLKIEFFLPNYTLLKFSVRY